MQQGFSGNVTFLNAIYVGTGRIALIDDVELELVFLYRRSVEPVYVSHHQVPKGHVGRHVDTSQQLDIKTPARIFLIVGRDFADLIRGTAVHIFEGYSKTFILL